MMFPSCRGERRGEGGLGGRGGGKNEEEEEEEEEGREEEEEGREEEGEEEEGGEEEREEEEEEGRGGRRGEKYGGPQGHSRSATHRVLQPTQACWVLCPKRMKWF